VYLRWVLPLPDDPAWVVPERIARSGGSDAIKDSKDTEDSSAREADDPSTDEGDATQG
jgi:hypothetical protein